MSDIIEVSFTYEYEDAKKVFIENYFSNTTTIILQIWSTLTFLFVTALIIAAAIRYGMLFENVLIYIIVESMAVFFAFLPFFLVRASKIRWETSRNLPLTANWIINAKSVNILRKYAHTNIQWNQFHKIIEFKNGFGFYLNTSELSVLPKRVLTEEQIILLRKLILTSVDIQFVKVKLMKNNNIGENDDG